MPGTFAVDRGWLRGGKRCRVVIGASGRLWWNLGSSFPVVVSSGYLLVTQ